MKRAFFAVLLLALVGCLFFAGNVPSALQQDQPGQTDDTMLNGNTLDGTRATSLTSLMAARASGVPFAVQEIEILDAFEAGLSIASIEAEVVISRALYDAYVAGKVLDNKRRDLLERYRVYNNEHARDTVTRNAVLNADYPDAKGILAPDGSDDWELYSNPELFNQLSSAFQNRLERIYGHKGKVRSKTSPAGPAAESPDAPPALPNTLVNNPAADIAPRNTQSETSLVLGSGNNILVSFNDSGLSAAGQHFTGIARSTNSGTSFTDQGALPVSASGDAGDPVYARNNTTGTIILSTLGFSSGAVMQIFRTTDDGVSYGAPVNGAAGGGSHDKEWLAADNFAGAGNGNFYMFWRDFGAGGGMTITRSTNDGVTWGNRQVLDAAAGQGGWIVVGADHTVHVFWLKSGPNRIVTRRSTDFGVTFGAVSTVATLTTTGVNGDFGLNGGFRSNAFPQIACNATNSQRLYMTFTDTGAASGDKADVYFTYSLDGGVTWAPRSRVNSDTTATDQWQPVIAMTPDGSGVFVSWYDRRGNGNAIDVYGTDGSICADGSVAFVPNYRITDTAFPVVVGVDPAIVSTYMGDYDHAVATNTNYYRTWGDNRSGNPDVRFTVVPKSPPGVNLQANGSTLGAESCTPDNNVIDPGETVTVTFGLKNFGGVATSSLVATLQATGGVTLPSAPQNFGALASCGGAATRNFTFTASGSCGGIVTATLQLQDGATNLGTVTYTFSLGTSGGGSQVFSNPAAITINDNAAGAPYPSNVTVSGVTAYIRVTVAINGFSHTFPDDVDIILVAPGGQKAYVLSDNGSGTDIAGVNLVFDDNAAAALTTATIISGTYKPSNLDTSTDAFPAPAPAGPYAGTFAGFNGLGAGVNGTWSLYVRDDVGTDVGSISGGWSITFINPLCSTSCATPTPTPAPTPTPTPTPALVSISGTVVYCSNPALNPVPAVTMTLTGPAPAPSSTPTNGSGNYTLPGLTSGASYTVVPTKTALAPGHPAINTIDVVATQRHFLNLGPPLSGCQLTAADVDLVPPVNTIDVIGVQRFFLGLTTGLGSTGQYRFTPANRAYPAIAGNQTAQNYNALIFGDVAASFAHRPEGDPEQDYAGSLPSMGGTIALPEIAVDQTKSTFSAAVTTSAIDKTSNLVGFQGDFTFDERVITFGTEPVQKAGITAGNWNVSGNVLAGTGPIRTLRISAYSNDFRPLSGSGTLFELKVINVNKAAQGTQLLWAAAPNQFIFIDADLHAQEPGTAAPGSILPSGKRQ